MAYAALFILLIAADRITKNLAVSYLMEGDKSIIPHILTLHYLENSGAAWGVLQNAFILFFIITIVVLGVMVVLYAHIPFEKHYTLLRFSVILLSAGAIGNFIDRAVWHYVVDFIYLECIKFPVFNVADCYVCISAVLLIYCLVFKYKDDNFLWKKS